MEEEKIENELNDLMNEFKVPDNQITHIIKSALEKNIQSQLFDALKNFVIESEDALEQVCSANYRSLLESINKICILQEEFEKFRSTLSVVTEQSRTETTKLKSEIDHVINLNNARNNIEKSKKMLISCLPALDVFIKLSHESKNDIRKALEYYKVLELELIPPVKDFRFIRNISESLPIIKENLRKGARDSVLEFLEQAKSVGQHVGKCVLNHAMFNAGLTEPTEFYLKEIEGILDILDFSNLQRYALVINEIGIKGMDEQFYKNERLLQVNILSDWSNTLGKDMFKNFCDHLLRLIGFFVIELFVSNNIPNTFSKGQLNEIFDRCSQSLVYQLETQCELNDIAEVSELRRLLSNTHYVMSICGLYSSILKDSEKIVKKKYNEIVSKLASEKLSEFKNVEKLRPLVLNSQEEEKSLFSLLPLPKSYRGDFYPKTLPFSVYVPTVYDEVMKYVENTLEFNNDRTKANVEIEYDMKISAKHFFSCTICKNLLSILDRCQTISQYVQMYYDVFFLDSYLPILDSKISHISRNLINNESPYSKLDLRNDPVFKTVLSEVEHSLANFIECKLDQYIQAIITSTYQIHKKKSNRLMSTESLVNFLDAALEITSKIPSDSSTNISIHAIKHITRSIFSILSQPNVIVSDYTIKTLSECMEFLNGYICNTTKLDVDQITKNNLIAELTETFSLISKNDWNYFFDTYHQKDSIYCHINPKQLINLFSKLHSSNSKHKIVGAFHNMFRSNITAASDSLSSENIIAKLNQLLK